MLSKNIKIDYIVTVLEKALLNIINNHRADLERIFNFKNGSRIIMIYNTPFYVFSNSSTLAMKSFNKNNFKVSNYRKVIGFFLP